MRIILMVDFGEATLIEDAVVSLPNVPRVGEAIEFCDPEGEHVSLAVDKVIHEVKPDVTETVVWAHCVYPNEEAEFPAARDLCMSVLQRTKAEL